ncbi:unnamed protein product [Paramecium sonneborni]|uniref:Uncharacterized protein n=1 Tax=Paramecium sonneborni TaxID=65129 RepID=A0A8S1M991_9CILI|nr:unnamed protein product [Paramecium sonneborni]
MKEPFLVKFVVQNNFNFNQDEQMRLPLKKINQILTITKERFIIFLQKKNLIQSSDLESIHFEFFDRSQNKFVEEKQVFDFYNNLFAFPKEFFGIPEILEIRLIFEINYWQLKEIERDFKVYQRIQQQLIDQQNELRNELDNQISEFEVMNKYLSEIYNLENEQILIKKIEEIQKRKVDIVIIYSSPLVQIDNDNNISNAQFIDYEREISNIQQEIKLSEKDIQYKILLATKDNLDEAMNSNPQIMHLIINGDYDPISGYYFELQDGGIVDKLPLEDLIQQLYANKRKLRRLKLISISSMIAKDIIHFPQNNDNNPYLIENVQNFASVTFVGQIKFFNSDDKFGNQFWKSFYKQLFDNKSLEVSYNSAKQDVQKLFDQNFKNKITDLLICCCFHVHNEDCLKDPSKISYTLSHKQHLKCSKQKFLHYNCNTEISDPNQCVNGCLGQIYHNNKSLKCKLNEDNCELYDKRYKIIQDNFIPYINSYDRSEILKIDIPMSLLINEQQEKNVCCCFEYRVFNNRIIDNKQTITEHKKHQVSEKFAISSPKGSQEFNGLEFEQLSSNKEVSYLKINKQIIIINGKDYYDNDALIEQIIKYFKKFCKINNNKLEIFPEKYQLFLTKQERKKNIHIIQIPSTFQEMILNVNSIFEKHEKGDNTLKIIIIKIIDQYCQEQKFEQLYEDLLNQFYSKDNIVIIFEVSFKNITLLNKFKNEEFFQQINFHEIQESLEKEKQEKQ